MYFYARDRYRTLSRGARWILEGRPLGSSLVTPAHSPRHPNQPLPYLSVENTYLLA